MGEELEFSSFSGMGRLGLELWRLSFLFVFLEFLGVEELPTRQLVPHKSAHQIMMGHNLEDLVGIWLQARW